MKKPMIITLILQVAIMSYAQQSPYIFYGEKTSKDVRLIFIPESWPQGVRGFIIMKKTNSNTPWVNLHEGVLIPEISKEKALTNVVNYTAYLQHLTIKRDSLIDHKKLNTIDKNTFATALEDEQTYRAIRLFIGRDFDIALIAGLAIIDGQSNGEETLYGLFPITKEDKPGSAPVKTIQFNDGEPPLYALETTNKSKQAGNKVALHWEINEESYAKNKVFNGFNIYRSQDNAPTLKLNKTPIWMKNDNGMGNIYFDDEIQGKEPVTYYYEIRAVTLFNTEFTAGSFSITTKKTDSFAQPPDLQEESIGANYNDGVRLYWQAMTGTEVQKQFIERKETLAGVWENITGDMNKETDTYQDQSSLKEGTQYFYRLSVILGDGRMVRSKTVYISKKKD